MTNCGKCGKKSVIFVRYSGAHLCRDHFCEFVEKRVKHELRQQMSLRGGERIAIAVSGGKDSTVALHLLKGILGARKDLAFMALTIDEGISGYRLPSIPIVSQNCRKLGIEHKVVAFKDLFRITMDDIAARNRELSTCSYCGVLRRAALNRTAREWDATYLATGHNLDDTAQSILMNFARGDIERLVRLGPHKNIQPGLVPRIQPLRAIPESETMLYAMLSGFRWHNLECPYASEASRNDYRSVVSELEDRYPGTKHSILRSYAEILPALEKSYEPAKLGICECGEPTISKKCKACELVESITVRVRT